MPSGNKLNEYHNKGQEDCSSGSDRETPYMGLATSLFGNSNMEESNAAYNAGYDHTKSQIEDDD